MVLEDGVSPLTCYCETYNVKAVYSSTSPAVGVAQPYAASCESAPLASTQYYVDGGNRQIPSAGIDGSKDDPTYA